MANNINRVVNLTLVAGWEDANSYVWSNNVNNIIIRCRTSQPLQLSHEKNGVFFTLDAGDKLTLSGFNAHDDVIYFRGAVGAVVEIIETLKP